MNTPDGIEVTPRYLSGKPYLVLTRHGNVVIAHVPLKVRRKKDGQVLLADITIRQLRSHGVDPEDLEG